MIAKSRLHLFVPRHGVDADASEPDHRPCPAQQVVVRVGIGEEGLVEGVDVQRGRACRHVRPPSASASQSAMKSRPKLMLSAPTCSTPPSRSVKIFSSRLGLLVSCS